MGSDLGTSRMTAPDGVTPADRGWTSAGLFAHAVAVAAVLGILFLVIDHGHAGFSDEGAYAAQVDNLAKGSWSAPLAAPEIDLDGSWRAIVGSVVDGDRYIPYASHVLYPLLLLPWFRAWGFAGALLTSTLSVMAAAVGAAAIARRIKPSLAVPTLWTVALASPLLFDAYLLAGHGLAAALSAVLALLVIRSSERDGVRELILAGLVAIVLTMVRSEGLIVVIAVALAAPLLARTRSARSMRRLTASAVALVVAGVTAFFLNGMLTEVVTNQGGTSVASNVLARETGPLDAAWASLLRPWQGSIVDAEASMILSFAAVVLASLWIALGLGRPLVPTALLWLAAASAIVHHAHPPRLVTGLLAVFPIGVVGTAAALRSRIDGSVPRFLAVVSLVGTGGVLLASYRSGGATEWGGRYFHVFIPLVSPIAIAGLVGLRERCPRWATVAGGSALVVLALALSGTALRANADTRVTAADTVRTSMRFAAEHSTGPPLIVVSSFSGGAVSRSFWQQVGDGREILTTSLGLGELAALVESAERSGRSEMIVVTNVSVGLFEDLTRGGLADRGWSVAESAEVDRGTFVVLRLVLSS